MEDDKDMVMIRVTIYKEKPPFMNGISWAEKGKIQKEYEDKFYPVFCEVLNKIIDASGVMVISKEYLSNISSICRPVVLFKVPPEKVSEVKNIHGIVSVETDFVCSQGYY